MLSRAFRLSCLLAGLALVGAPSSRAAAAALATGVNIVNPMRASEAARAALVAQLKGAGVHLVRCGLTDDAAGVAFARALYDAGIRIDLIVGLQYAPGAPARPYNAADPGMWAGHPLSAADPALSRAALQSLLAKLDGAGVVLAGLEIGNEINWAAFNAEFPLPGEGRVFDLDGLSSDAEGRQVAAGFAQYVKVVAAMKQARDASAANRATPIVAAGLASVGAARTAAAGRPQADGVTIAATLRFLRSQGLDRVVDAYGVHVYPWQKTADARTAAILSEDVGECGRAGAKACWITEWGYNNASLSCPLDDAARAALAQQTLQLFRDLAAQGRVTTAIYFSWSGDPWAKRTDPGSVYRCGGLTAAGRAALAP